MCFGSSLFLIFWGAHRSHTLRSRLYTCKINFSEWPFWDCCLLQLSHPISTSLIWNRKARLMYSSHHHLEAPNARRFPLKDLGHPIGWLHRSPLSNSKRGLKEFLTRIVGHVCICTLCVRIYIYIYIYNIYICMYVCMYVCMWVVYIYIYICIDMCTPVSLTQNPTCQESSAQLATQTERSFNLWFWSYFNSKVSWKVNFLWERRFISHAEPAMKCRWCCSKQSCL